MVCDIDKEDLKVWKTKYGFEANECILTKLKLVNPSECPLRSCCKEILEVIKK